MGAPDRCHRRSRAAGAAALLVAVGSAVTACDEDVAGSDTATSVTRSPAASA